jgi:hypothetical protein
MAAPPNKTELVDDYPNPSTGVFKAGIGKFYDYVKGLLGATGNAAEALLALGAAALNSPAFTGTPTAPTPASSDNSTKIATTAWAKLGFVVLLASVGYIKLPDWLGGIILQWGYSGTSAIDVGITFPLAFPTQCLYVGGVIVQPSLPASSLLTLHMISVSATVGNFTKRFSNGSTISGATDPFYWFAVGR